MKRFSAREFALLCLPVAVVAGAGFWAARRGVPLSVDLGKPKLQFHVEKTTALQAFNCPNGCVAAVTMELSKNWRGTPYEFTQRKFWIETQTPQGKIRWPGYGTWPKDIGPGFTGNSQETMFLSKMPSSKITFGLEGMIVPTPNTNATQPVQVSGQWELDPSEVKAFNFNIPRDPLLQLQTVTFEGKPLGDASIGFAYSVASGKVKEYEMAYRFQPIHSVWDIGSYTIKQEGKFYIRASNPTYANAKATDIHLNGSLSLNNGWPLSFEIEPFDYKSAKVGQQLKFKSWPAPLPLGVVLKK